MQQRGRTSWRRWVARGVVCLSLGLVTTVGVAWGATMLGSEYGARCANGRIQPSSPSAVNEVWRVDIVSTQFLARRGAYAVPRDGAIDFLVEVNPGNSVRVADISKLHHAAESWGTVRPSRAPIRGYNVEQAAGWPRLAMWRKFGFIQPKRAKLPLFQTTLPTRPIGSGIAIDSLFYATIWGVVLIVPPIVRARVRRRRGNCPMCGYDLVHKFDAGCSECGWNKAD